MQRVVLHRVVQVVAVTVLLAGLGGTLPATAQPGAEPAWEDGSVVKLDGATVTLSKPRLVARSKGFLWFPTLHQFGPQRYVVVMSNYADEAREVPTALFAWSEDGGLTWSPPESGRYSECAIAIDDARTILLPYYLRFDSDSKLTGYYQTAKPGTKQWQFMPEGLEVTGWPRKVSLLPPDLGGARPEWKLGSFVFNGQSVRTKDGKLHLSTLYGRFAGTKRYSLVVAESADGLKWKIRSVVADENCKLAGNEGPCESALVRLKDGRLLCIYRLDSGVPYGHSFSTDDGLTWSEPQALNGPKSVQPSLAVSPQGWLALSGGRPGLMVWLDRQGDARRWEGLDLAANHNAYVKDDPIRKAEVSFDSNTSAYTEICWVDERHFLVVYDRLAMGWKAIPPDSKETNSVWIVRGRVDLPK